MVISQSLKEARSKIRKLQLEQTKDFRRRGWNDVADRLENELSKQLISCDNEDGEFEKGD